MWFKSVTDCLVVTREKVTVCVCVCACMHRLSEGYDVAGGGGGGRGEERKRGWGGGLNAPAMERRNQACLGYLDTTSNHLSPSTATVAHHPPPSLSQGSWPQTVKVQRDRGPWAWQLTAHYAPTTQNCDLIKYADVTLPSFRLVVSA